MFEAVFRLGKCPGARKLPVVLHSVMDFKFCYKLLELSYPVDSETRAPIKCILVLCSYVEILRQYHSDVVLEVF